MKSIAACCNVYNEANALPGWLENVSAWADHVTVYHCGPGGERSTDGTIEMCEKWGVDLRFGSIDEGFGVARTKMVTMCPTDWVAIMDADERIYPFAARLTCSGNDRYPDVAAPNLTVHRGGVYNQIAALQELIDGPHDAIVCSRRHWFNFHADKPCQNFQQHPDWQARILRCAPYIGYRSEVRMHEQLIDARHGGTPAWFQPTAADCEVFFDHYHCFFKAMEGEQRRHDVAIYDALHDGRKPPTLREFRGVDLEPDGDCA